MDVANQLHRQIDRLFHPRSIAIVGLPRGMKAGKLFLLALLDQEYSGKIYPVHPTAREIDGHKTYASVSEIPADIDLAIILVPHQSVLSVVQECADKGVKGAVLFTAGYKETGTSEGRALEAELVRIGRSSGMRLIGPNCMGLYSPDAGLSFFPGLSREPGPVGLISHSGSMANILCRVAQNKGVCFSRAVSLGNECDLNSSDFLAYLGNDPDTRVIGAYIESIKDGTRFLETLQKTALKKPVILWKVGLTPAGGRAASSHTGAIASSKDIWQSVVSQGGAIPVTGFEALLDMLMGFTLLPADMGDRVATLSGPGGLAVGAADACGNAGLRLAELSPDTQSDLSTFVPPTGTSLANPVDVGLTASLEMDIYVRAARTVAADPGVDALVVVGSGMDQESNQRYMDAMIQARREFSKPFIMVAIPGFDAALARSFCQAGLPFFETSERAMAVYAKILAYQRWRESKLHSRAGT
jgi:acyl-CoA synthetase (NDP forming)